MEASLDYIVPGQFRLQSKTLSLFRKPSKQNNNTTSVLEASGSVGVTAGGLKGVDWAGFSPGCSVWRGAAAQVTR